MKRSALPLILMLVGIAIGGCASRMNVDVLQARIREQSLQLTESEREIARTRSELKRAREDADRLRAEFGQTQSQGVAAQAKVDKVQIYSFLSGGINKDDQPGDDAVVVQFAPCDRDNQPMNVPGALEIVLIDPQQPIQEQEMGRWTFTKEECQNQWTRGLASSGFQVTLPLDEPARHHELIVQLTYTDAADHNFDASRRVKVAVPPPGTIARRNRPAHKKKAMPVVEEPDDDLPPVGVAATKEEEEDFRQLEREQAKRPVKSADKILHSSSWTDATIPQYR